MDDSRQPETQPQTQPQSPSQHQRRPQPARTWPARVALALTGGLAAVALGGSVVIGAGSNIIGWT